MLFNRIEWIPSGTFSQQIQYTKDFLSSLSLDTIFLACHCVEFCVEVGLLASLAFNCIVKAIILWFLIVIKLIRIYISRKLHWTQLFLKKKNKNKRCFLKKKKVKRINLLISFSFILIPCAIFQLIINYRLIMWSNLIANPMKPFSSLKIQHSQCVILVIGAIIRVSWEATIQMLHWTVLAEIYGEFSSTK